MNIKIIQAQEILDSRGELKLDLIPERMVYLLRSLPLRLGTNMIPTGSYLIPRLVV